MTVRPGSPQAARPFLSIVTRACRRPRMLTLGVKSVLAQTCHDIEQVFLVDKSGNHPEGNILWANRQFALYKDRVIGHYVFPLDDDGVLVDPTFIAKLKAFAEGAGWPDVVLVRSQVPLRGGRIGELPPDDIWNVNWEMWERPDDFLGHAYNYVVRDDWWRAKIRAYVNADHGGDWTFADALFTGGAEVMRLHGVYSARSLQRGRGKVFEKDCPPDWFAQVARRFGIEDLGGGDWRLRLWLK